MRIFDFNFGSCFFLDLITQSTVSCALFLSAMKMLEYVVHARQEWLTVESNNCALLHLDPAEILWIDAIFLAFETGSSSKRE